MNSSNQQISLTTNQTHVFRMIGGVAAAISECKVAMSVAGFGDFKSYGHSFMCSKQVDRSRAKIVVYVQLEPLTQELCEVSFRKFGEHVSTLHQEIFRKRLNKVQTQLETKAA